MLEHRWQGPTTAFDENEASATRTERETQLDHDVDITSTVINFLKDCHNQVTVVQAQCDVCPKFAGVVAVVGSNDVAPKIGACATDGLIYPAQDWRFLESHKKQDGWVGVLRPESFISNVPWHFAQESNQLWLALRV